MIIGCLLLTAAQAAPPALTGTVKIDDTHGLAGASVRAFGSVTSQPAGTATTAADGTYRIPLARGVYRVEFSAEGFAPAVRSGVVVLDGSTNELNVILSKGKGRAESLDDVHPGEVAVRIETIYGSIFLAIDAKHAPITAANFLKYVDAGLYNGGRFHRATRPDNYTPAPPNRPAMELIQGGINPARVKDGFAPIPLERTSVTGLKHVAGTISMARATADSATSDFFILLDDQPSLDAGGKRFDDEQGAAAFGRVYFGLGVVRKIQLMPVQGQNLTPPIPIIRISRV